MLPPIHLMRWPSHKTVPFHLAQATKTPLKCVIVESAMRAVTHIMNDDLESAEAGLANGASSFHKVPYLFSGCPVTRLTGLEKELWLIMICWATDG